MNATHSASFAPTGQSYAAARVELSGFAHEFRNSIAPLANALEVIGCADADPRVAARMVTLAKRQVRQMSRLVSDLMDTGRLVNGDPDVQLVETTAQQLVEDAVRAWSHAATLRHHKLDIAMPVQPLGICVDPVRMQQVLGNMLANAIKYTPEGGVLQVRIARRDCQAVISVSDNGIGIDPDQIERMFEPFRQDPRARAISRDGMGLGLPIARRLAELQGGTLQASSAGKDLGSTFTLSLPIRENQSARELHS